MKRRDFLKTLTYGTTGALVLNQIPLQAMPASAPLNRLLANSTNDNVVVLIQMHGGNDGLNTLIPLYRYNEYYNIRPNIAIPQYGSRRYITLDSTVPAEAQIGLHPDMAAMKTMYDMGMASFVQNVAYANMNLSHFRSRDIWFMGGNYNDMFNSGWMGRFLEYEYPGYPENYPNAAMPDPPGIEMGNAMSIAFHRSNGIPAGISIGDPNRFYELIQEVGIAPPVSFPDSKHGVELKYLYEFEIKTNEYADRLKELWDKGKNTVDYPEIYPLNAPQSYQRNPLSEQFKIIARLLSGGSKTRIFLIRMGGFDSHAGQVESYDTSMGRHAALLYHLSTAVKAFYDDLENQGMANKVLSMTFSEFGRRAYSNGSYGTDHGTAGPIMLFGKGLKGGVYGKNPDLTKLNNGNLINEFDYRQVYSSVLKDWLGAQDTALQASNFGDFINQRLDLFQTTGIDQNYQSISPLLGDCYPNPVINTLHIPVYLSENKHMTARIYTSGGILVKEITNQLWSAGSHTLSAEMGHLPKGAYMVRVTTTDAQMIRKVVVQ